MSSWWLLLAMSAITFLNRYAFFTPSLRYKPNEKVQRFLSYSTFAILTAIWTPILFDFDLDQGFSHTGWDYIIGACIAGILSMLRVPSIIVVLLCTMVFFGLRFLF